MKQDYPTPNYHDVERLSNRQPVQLAFVYQSLEPVHCMFLTGKLRLCLVRWYTHDDYFPIMKSINLVNRIVCVKVS